MKKIFIIFILISVITNLYAQKKYTISGYITDKNTGESIIGANIYSKLTGKGVTSNTYGFYSLTVEEGQLYSFANKVIENLESDDAVILCTTEPL